MDALEYIFIVSMCAFAVSVPFSIRDERSPATKFAKDVVYVSLVIGIVSQICKLIGSM